MEVNFSRSANGASGEVIAICSENLDKWDHDRWARRLEKCLYGGFVFSSGWNKWGNIIGPLTKQERRRVMQYSKLSRPGPSYWKIKFLVFFLEWAQEA